MKTTLLLKEIYLEAFRNLGHFLIKHYFKAFSFFCLLLFIITLYAFIFRLATGFAFD